MYKQSLYAIHSTHLSTKNVKRNNKLKNYKYGYNDDLDCVVISKDGTIGEIFEVQGLRIALPAIPKEVYSNSEKPEDQVFKQT